MEKEILLSIENLHVHFRTSRGIVKALRGVNLQLQEGETLGLVGETGCGKSVTMRSIMRLIQSPPGDIVEGKIWFDGKNLLDVSESEMRKIRGKKIAMIFQDPATSLNPVFKVGYQIEEGILLHQGVDRYSANQRVLYLLDKVGMPAPERLAMQYPHELSGGMQQRVMIAMALACNPLLLIADEPTSSLDVTIQAQFLTLLKQLKREIISSIIYVSHDISVVADVCDQIGVMYLGTLVEKAEVKKILSKCLHPYTKGLFAALPELQSSVKELQALPGTVPSLIDPPVGCAFHPRCSERMEICHETIPGMLEVEERHYVACHLYH
jgi:oligopeptide/dipeptide ABC transporter ATP-binding protein